MKQPQFIKRFFGSTRGKILIELRRQTRTVAELAEIMALTDNAIRSHLTSLERDGLVRQIGERAGFRKPHLEYELSTAAEDLFPKAYQKILDSLIVAIKTQSGEKELMALLEVVSREVSAACRADKNADREARINSALAAIAALGGEVEVTSSEEETTLSAAGCPLSGTVISHPEVCTMMGQILTEASGVQVRQKCLKEKGPRCCFEMVWPQTIQK